MAKYRKIPVVIDAYCPYNGTMPDWFEKALIDRKIMECVSGGFDIITLEGIMHANQGDFIIMGVNGEFYPCKPDIFEKTYNLIDHNWVSSNFTTPSGKNLFYCTECYLAVPAPVKAEYETRPCKPDLYKDIFNKDIKEGIYKSKFKQ
jgi:hypothetical protein